MEICKFQKIEQFHNNWPNYFLKTKGCNVWDLDGNKFHDLSLMELAQTY